MLNSETFCMFYEKFEAYLPKILLRNYQRLKQTLPIWRYGVQKLNYQRSKLPISKVTNIEVYLYSENAYISTTTEEMYFYHVNIPSANSKTFFTVYSTADRMY